MALLLERRRPMLRRALVEIPSILFLFYANLLMGEFNHSSKHRTLSLALRDCITPHNFAIGLVAAVIGFIVFESLRDRL